MGDREARKETDRCFDVNTKNIACYSFPKRPHPRMTEDPRTDSASSEARKRYDGSDVLGCSQHASIDLFEAGFHIGIFPSIGVSTAPGRTAVARAASMANRLAVASPMPLAAPLT